MAQVNLHVVRFPCQALRFATCRTFSCGSIDGRKLQSCRVAEFLSDRVMAGLKGPVGGQVTEQKTAKVGPDHEKDSRDKHGPSSGN